MPTKNSKKTKKSKKNDSNIDLKSKTSESNSKIEEVPDSMLNDDKVSDQVVDDLEDASSSSSEGSDSENNIKSEGLRVPESALSRFPERRKSFHNVSDAGKDHLPKFRTELNVQKTTVTRVAEKKVSKREVSPEKHKKIQGDINKVNKSKILIPDFISKENFAKLVSHNIIISGTGIILCCILSLYYYYLCGNAIEKGKSIEDLKKTFIRQEPLLWRAIESGINDTLTFERPTSYIFLHESGSEKTMKKLLKELSEYTVCQLSNCNNSAIELDSEKISALEILEQNDYGTLIAKYKEGLETSGLMVVQNIDKFPEKYARAFHIFCDEISPLVKITAFFFTFQVDKFNEGRLYDVRHVEKALRQNWKGLDDDLFAPLFTRMSGMLLRVNPEKI